MAVFERYLLKIFDLLTEEDVSSSSVVFDREIFKRGGNRFNTSFGRYDWITAKSFPYVTVMEK